jgi:PAS domain S-box-containing protein
MNQPVEALKVSDAEIYQAEEKLERAALQQMVAADLSGQALSGWEVDSLMDAVVRLTAGALNVEFCSIFKLDKKGELLRLAAGVGWMPGNVGSATVSPREDSLAGYTLHVGGPLIVEDLRSDARFDDPLLLRDHGVVSSISVPMVAGRFIFGTMGAHSSDQRDFSQSDIHFLETMANIVTISVLRGQAVEALGQVNKGLLVARRHIERIMEVSPDTIISTDSKGWVILCNKVAEGLLGYSREEIVGKHVSKVYENKEHEAEMMNKIRENGNTLTGYESTLQAKDGSTIPVSISASIFHDESGEEAGTVAVFKDLTDHKKWEEELEDVKKELLETNQHLSRLMNISPDVIMTTDADGIVVLCNQGTETVLGYERDYITGQHISMLYEDEERATVVMHELQEQGGNLCDYETTIKAKDGSLIPFVVSATALPSKDGVVIGAVWYKKDLREIKRWEAEIEKANAGLEKAHNTIEKVQASALAAEKLAALGRLTAGVAHEILNPLNIVTLRLHMMIRNPDTPQEIVRHLKVLDEQANRIAKITEDLLYFARQRKPERRQIDLNETVNRTLGLLEYDLRKSNVDVVLSLGERLPTVAADQGQLQQVILNLLTNARDAMPEGGRLELITGATQENGYEVVELRVVDNGKGIEPADIDKLFEPFFTTKPEGEGTGLGLSICQGIVKSHGGSIWAESELRQGTTILVRLPCKESKDNGS